MMMFVENIILNRMNPKHAPYLSSIPETNKKKELVECVKSIKQQEQLTNYLRDMKKTK